MSSALAKASPLKPEIRLAQAISEFEAHLSHEQKSTFRTLRSQSLLTTPSPHDVMQLTAEVDRHTSKKFSSACFGPRFTNFLHGVQQFAALGDVVIGGSQNLLACGVWSLVRMSLLSIVNLSNYIDKLSSLFMDVGRSAPRYQAIALLYPRSTKLQSHLSEYFIVVVSLCRYLFNFGQKSTVQQFASSLSDAHLKTFQADLDKWATSIKGQIDVNEAQESSGFRALTRETFKSASYQQRLAANMRVLDFCSTYDHEIAWKQIRKAGNTSFYRQQAEYKEWRDSSHPSTLLYRGKLGSGKSVLLANIVDDLSLSTEKALPLVAYFFCKHDIPESLQARTIIGSLARQLLRTVPDLSVPAKNCENTHTIGDTNTALETLFRGFPSDVKVYFVLDGLDECDNEEKETLVQAIRKIQVKLKVLVCASFREEPNNGLQSITNQLLATRAVFIPDDNPDIDAFIEADLERCLRQECLTIGDPALILDIQDALSKGSQGMFLWVALQIRSLCSMKTDHAIREALADLPKDLSETFARILRKSGSSDPALQAKTLQSVLAAYRPLTTDELREALSVTPGDATWDPSRILNDAYSALACCGCLLAVDEEELTVRVVHHSVKQYVLDGLNGVKHIGFSFDEAQRMLADTVVTYLGYGVFGTELSRVKVHPMVAQSAPSKIVQATIGSSSTARYLAIKLLGSRGQQAFDVSKALADARSSLSSKPEHAFRFYTYAKTYWQDHVFYVSGHKDAIFKLCSKLIYSRASELNKVDKDYWTRFQWAVENRNGNVLVLLSQAGKIDLNARDSRGWTPLMRAAEGGHRDTVEVLLSVGKADVEAKDSDGWTPLMRAALRGHSDTVETLLSVGKADVEAKDSDGWTPLMRAAEGGHRDTVEVLLSVGKADVEAKDSDGWTPLMRAAEGGHRDAVEVLLSVGKADVEAKDSSRSTPLMRAALRGHSDTVETLLSVGKADVEAKDRDGQTPLMQAAEGGHRDTVEVLLSVGKADVEAKDSGHRDTVEVLLSVGKADVEAKDRDGRTPLMWAAQNGHRDTVETLLSVGKADVEAKDRDGRTPLMWAAQNGHRDTVEVLLSVGKADVEANDSWGWTPLMQAAEGGHRDTVEVLLSVGKADVEANDSWGWTPLMQAAHGGHIDTVEVLLSVGKADVEAKDSDGQTPLMWAAQNGHRDTVEVLLSVGKADVEAKDSDGQTPLMWAAQNGHRDTVEVLLSVGKADVEAKDRDGQTPLKIAYVKGITIL
ncbi:Arp, Ankyrin repeat protein [Pyrenophora tritici-repentis]|nr:Arp, Ankyrin repeat protein [Pyrenophora tritici-repentis]